LRHRRGRGARPSRQVDGRQSGSNRSPSDRRPWKNRVCAWRSTEYILEQTPGRPFACGRHVLQYVTCRGERPRSRLQSRERIGDHVDDAVELAADHGFEIRKTEEAGDATRFARDVAPDADLVAAAGGDGTLNAVVNGVAAADALETTTVAVVPAGTGNNFAANIGVRGLEHAFTVIEDGRRRSIDIAMANDRIFVNSCVGGITAEASSETTTESKAEAGRARVREEYPRDGRRVRLAPAASGDDRGSGTARRRRRGRARRCSSSSGTAAGSPARGPHRLTSRRPAGGHDRRRRRDDEPARRRGARRAVRAGEHAHRSPPDTIAGNREPRGLRRVQSRRRDARDRAPATGDRTEGASRFPPETGISRIRTKESCGRSRRGRIGDRRYRFETSETRRYWFHEPS